MASSRARLGILVLLLLVAGSVATLAQNVDPGSIPKDETTTRCWSCHSGDTPPLKTFYNIIPPDEVGVAVGETFEYTIRVENPWQHDITFINPTLDLRDAPSLRFYDPREPLSLDAAGAIPVDPTQPTAPQRGHVVLEVPVGATGLVFTVTPGGATPVDIAVRVFPGKETPSGEPAYVVDEAGAGGAETFDVADVDGVLGQDLPYGNWSVEVQTFLLDPESGSVNIPSGQTIGFTVQGTADFRAGAVLQQSLARSVLVGPGANTLVTWRMEVQDTPAPGETVLLTVNATVHWKHGPNESDIDWENITKSVRLDVVDPGDGSVALEPSGGFVPPESVDALGTLTLAAISEAVGYAASFLLVASVWTGGMFGKASRRQLNRVFGSAKRRVAFHNFLSYGLTAAAGAHLVMFLIETRFYWTLGLIWGGLALLSMVGLGVTGALQVPMIRRWNYATWRWIHLGLAIASLVFTLIHLLLDGIHFGQVQEWLHWTDPLDMRDVR